MFNVRWQRFNILLQACRFIYDIINLRKENKKVICIILIHKRTSLAYKCNKRLEVLRLDNIIIFMLKVIKAYIKQL